jgi:hypothetical protein
MEEIEVAMRSGDLEAAQQALLRVAADAEGEDALRCAGLAQRLGLAAVAMRCCQQALRSQPEPAGARELLVVLYEERGDLERAAGLREGRGVGRAGRIPSVGLQGGSARVGAAQTARDPEVEEPPKLGRDGVPDGAPDDGERSTGRTVDPRGEALEDEPPPGADRAPSADDGGPRHVDASRIGGVTEQAASPGSPAEVAAPAGPPGTADLVRFIERFAGRPDVHARMWYDRVRGVGYSPVRHPLTLDVLRAHLDGALTAGIYLVHPDETVQVVVFDVDASKVALERAAGDPARTAALRRAVHGEATRLLTVLRRLGLDPVLEDSGFKGRHLWLFLPDPVPAGRAVAFGRALLASTAPRPEGVKVELFPKQAGLSEGGLGNLVKLPLGIHLRSGRRAELLDDEGRVEADPFGRVRRARRVALPELELVEAPPERPTPPPSLPPLPEQAPRPFTASRFETSPWLGPVLQGCHVLRAVVEEAVAKRALSAEAPLVLNHTLGHLPDGVEAVNYLYGLVGGVSESARLVSRLKGQPTGCGKIRGRLGEIVARVPCACSFAPRPGEHAHPLRHLDGVVLSEAKASGIDDLVLGYTRQLHVLARAQAEADTLRLGVIAALEGVPGQRWAAPGGEWAVGEEGGMAVLRFDAAAGGEP